MIGAIVGDIIGSVHEGAGTKTKDFPLFDRKTDATHGFNIAITLYQILNPQDGIIHL